MTNGVGSSAPTVSAHGRPVELSAAAFENVQSRAVDVGADVSALRYGAHSRDSLLAHYLAGAPDDRAGGWRDYVTAVEAAARIKTHVYIEYERGRTCYATDTPAERWQAKSALRAAGLDSTRIYVGDPNAPDKHPSDESLQALRVGDRIKPHFADERNAGRVIALDGDSVTIEWDSGLRTTQSDESVRLWLLSF